MPCLSLLILHRDARLILSRGTTLFHAVGMLLWGKLPDCCPESYGQAQTQTAFSPHRITGGFRLCLLRRAPIIFI